MIRTDENSFPIIHGEKSFFISSVLSKFHKGGNGMKGNVVLRGYLASHYTVDAFVSHVKNCVIQQLREFGCDTELYLDSQPNFFLFYGHVNNELYHLLLTRNEVDQLKAAGPYALDRALWEVIFTRYNYNQKKFSSSYLKLVFCETSDDGEGDI